MSLSPCHPHADNKSGEHTTGSHAETPEPNRTGGLAGLFIIMSGGLDTSARWVPRAESYRGKCQEGHVGGGSPKSTSARSQGRAAPAIALRPPPSLGHAMHAHAGQEHLSLRHSACLAHTSASSVRAHAATEQHHLCKMASIIDSTHGRLTSRTFILCIITTFKFKKIITTLFQEYLNYLQAPHYLFLIYS